MATDLNFLPSFPAPREPQEPEIAFNGGAPSRELKVRSPAFTDAALTKPGIIHLARCPASPDSGIVRLNAICKCHSGIRIAPLGARIAILEETSISVRCVMSGSAPFWVERLTTREATGEEPPRARRYKIPDDYRKLELYTGEHGRPPGHQRTGERHEIVLHNKSTWRIFAYKGDPSSTDAVLIRPMLSAENALGATFQQIKIIDRKKVSKLRPVFPLPDGTENPGWK